MSLDQNLFTLLFAPSKDDPNVTDLVDPGDTPHYRKERVQGSVYKINVYDPISQSLLASATAPSATSKHKTIELHNPSHIVELKYTGTLTFKWKFQWEDHEFEWKREECFMIRKPDPAVLVAVTKEQSGRLKTSSVQILDYNLNRFDINDRKGLEIVILTALLTFQDSNDAYHVPPTPVAEPSLRASFFGTVRRASDPAQQPQLSRTTSEADAAPPLPPRPPPKTGVDAIAEAHALRAAQGESEANEVLVDTPGAAEDYAAYAATLLADDALLFVTLRSAAAAHVPKVLAVVEHTKRLRHKAGADDAQALHQYVVYDTAQPRAPRRINLDDPAPGARAYAPPTSLSVHLSKIDMPELQPRAESTPAKARAPAATPPPSPSEEKRAPEKEKGKAKKKTAAEKREEREREKELLKEQQRQKEREAQEEKERIKAQKKAEKEAKKKKPEKEAKKSEQKGKSGPSKPEVNKLTRPHVATSSSSYHPGPSQTSYLSPTSPGFQPPSPSFPQAHSPAPSPSPRPSSAFYSGVSFPANMSSPPSYNIAHARSSSYYGPGSFQNPNVAPGFNPNILQP